jgi:hypothetical protein
MPDASESTAASRASRIHETQEAHLPAAVQRRVCAISRGRAISQNKFTFWDAEGVGEGALDDEAGVDVSDWGTLEPSGALIDTLGTSRPLTLTPLDAEGAAGARGGRFFLAPGGI